MAQSLKLRLQQMRTEYKSDQELRDLVPWPSADAEYDPDDDAGHFGDAWSEFETVPEGEDPKDGHLLLKHWRQFVVGAGVFDLHCEIRNNVVQVPTKPDSQEVTTKSKTKRAKTKPPPAMRKGYLPLQLDKDLAMSNFPKTVRTAFESFSTKIRDIVQLRAKTKAAEDLAEKLKETKAKMVADAKAKEAEATAKALTAQGVICVCFFMFAYLFVFFFFLQWVTSTQQPTTPTSTMQRLHLSPLLT